MKLSGFIIGLMVFGLFVGVMFSLGVDLHTEFGVAPDSETIGIYNNISNSELYDYTNTLGSYTPGGGDVDVGNDPDMTYEDKQELGILQFLSIVPQVYTIFSSTLNTLVSYLGINEAFLFVAKAAVFIIISIILIAVWRRVSPF